MKTLALVKEFWEDTLEDVELFLKEMENINYELIDGETLKNKSGIILTFKTDKNDINEIVKDLENKETCWMQLLRKDHTYNKLGFDILTMEIKPNNVKYANSINRDKK